MALPWRTVAEADTPDGKLVLRRRGTLDVLLTIDGRVLMSSMAHRSEVELVRRAAERMQPRDRPHVLIAGLGLGFSLQAALQSLPERARIVVCELNPDIVRWARGPIADLVAPLLDDPRVTVIVDDVSHLIGNAAAAGGQDRFDAIILDLYTGPNEELYGKKSPLFGAKALTRTREALTAGGVFAIWSEEADPIFEKRARSIGLDMERERSKGKGPRYVIYLGVPSGVRPRQGPIDPSGAGTAAPRRPNSTSTRRRTTGANSRPGTGTGTRGPKTKSRPSTKPWPKSGSSAKGTTGSARPKARPARGKPREGSR